MFQVAGSVLEAAKQAPGTKEHREQNEATCLHVCSFQMTLCDPRDNAPTWLILKY